MMEYFLGFLIGVVITWVILMIVIPIARKLADFSMPPWPETMAYLAVIAALVNAVQLGLGLVNVFAALIVSAIVFFTLLYKWFDIDLWGAIIIVVVSWAVRWFLTMVLLGLLHSLGM
jgi:uncharacterized membrane protein YagU involved in acid resistance